MGYTTQHPPIMSPELLTKAAGATCYQAALALAAKHKIEEFHADSKSATACINGYQVKINYRKDHVEGACQCPDSDGFDFCQHCVYLCLHANKSTQQIISLSKGPDKSKILAFLLSQDKQTLAKHCLELIKQDAEQFDRYLLKASLSAETINYSQLKAQITDLTRKQENLFSQRQVRHFFAKIERFVEELALINLEHEPEKLLKVIEHAFARLNRLLEVIDDSTEQRSKCVTRFRQIYIQLISIITGKPETKTKRFYTLWLNDQFELLSPQTDEILASLSQKVFKNTVIKAWEKHLKTDEERPSNANLLRWQKNKIIRYLLEDAIRNNDKEKEGNYRNALNTSS